MKKPLRFKTVQEVKDYFHQFKEQERLKKVEKFKYRLYKFKVKLGIHTFSDFFNNLKVY